MLFTALRLSEAVALNLDDVQVTARKGRIVVRSGKGDLLGRSTNARWVRQAQADPHRRCVLGAGDGVPLGYHAAEP